MLFYSKNHFITTLFAACLLLNISAAQASEGKDEKKPAGPIYVDFKNIVVPVIKKDGKTGVVALALLAEVKDDEDKTKVNDNLPKLRDAFIRTLYGNIDSGKFKRADGALDIDYIKERLMQTAAYVMKDDKESPIKDILFQNIALQSY